MNDTHTAKAVGALAAAAVTEPDYGTWLSGVLATVADRLGGSGALVAARPGSWESELVVRLAEGGIPLDTGPCPHNRIDLATQLLALTIAAAVVNGDNAAAAAAAERAGACSTCLVLCLMHFAVGLAAEVSGDNTWPVSARLTGALLTAIKTTERELRDTYN